MNIAGCLIKKSEFKLALDQLERATNVVKQIDDKQLLSSLNIQFGIAYRELEKWDRARQFLWQTIDISEEWDLPYNLADALLNLALIDIATSSFERAKKRLSRAREIFEELKNEDKIRATEEAMKGVN